MEEHADDNEKRAASIEAYMIEEAEKAGVVKTITKRKFKNPNRWEKQLAPWFSEECKETRNTYKKTKKQYGRQHELS
jgi:hypothetical protein